MTVGADEQGRIDVAGLTAALEAHDGPTIVALQAGDVHSGAFDDFEAAIDVAHLHGAWVHVDGAFGLWAAASPRLRHLFAGAERADSWATDAHKTLNVPYDCGVAIVRDEAAMTAALGAHAEYLPAVATIADPYDRVPELSRRARGRAGLGRVALARSARRRRPRRRPRRCRGRAGRRIPGDPGSRGAQRRRLHPGVPRVTAGRRHDRAGGVAARRGNRLGVLVHVARPRGGPIRREQPRYRRRRPSAAPSTPSPGELRRSASGPS